VLDEPIDLPEGGEVDLVLADEQDDLDGEDRARLHAAFDRARVQVQEGEVIDKTTSWNGSGALRSALRRLHGGRTPVAGSHSRSLLAQPASAAT
jgi:hypothetical protein